MKTRLIVALIFTLDGPSCAQPPDSLWSRTFGGNGDDVCYSVQETAFASTVEVTERALAFTGSRELMVVGGVAANRRLAGMLEVMVGRHSASLHMVPPRFSGDCGAQIAWTGLLAYRAGISIPVAKSVIRQSWRLDTVPTPWR